MKENLNYKSALFQYEENVLTPFLRYSIAFAVVFCPLASFGHLITLTTAIYSDKNAENAAKITSKAFPHKQ